MREQGVYLCAVIDGSPLYQTSCSCLVGGLFYWIKEMFLHEQKELEITVNEDGYLILKQEGNQIDVSPLYIDIFISLLNAELKGE